MVGALAVVLTMVTFGTATFSYVRYYSYFPTIFAFPLVYYSVVIFNDYLTEPSFKPWRLFIVPLMLASMLLTHVQEAAFAVCLVAGIILLRTVRTITKRFEDALLCRRARLLCYIVFLIGISFFTYSLSVNEMNNWGHTPHVIDMGVLTPTFLTTAHSQEIKVFVDDAAANTNEWQKIIDWGVDGIQTNHPQELIDFLNRKK